LTELDIAKVNKMIKDNKIQIIDLKFNDLPGLWQHFSIMPREMVEGDGIWVEGIGFDGSSIRGFQQIQESDMILIPDPTTAQRPSLSAAYLSIIVTSGLAIRNPELRSIHRSQGQAYVNR
jgi:glutamine synthetase